MRSAVFLSALLLLTAAVAFAPTAAAHVCGNASGPGGSASGSVDENGEVSGRSGGSGDWKEECGPCVDGEDHVHGSAQGDGADASADGCVSSKHFVAGLPPLASVLVAALAALATAAALRPGATRRG